MRLVLPGENPATPLDSYLLKPLVLDRCIDGVCHGYVLFGDAAFGVRNQRESHGAPTNVNIRMVVLSLGEIGHPAHGVDAGEERGKLDGSAQRTVGPLPSAELSKRGVDLLIA